MCEGASRDEALFWVHGIIERHGWFIQYVEVEPVRRAWAYSIGLSAGFSHPELVVVGVTPEQAARLINGVGEMIREGERFTPEDCLLDPSERHIHFSKVHPNHFRRGVFAVWKDYYKSLGPPLPPAKALEVVPPGRKSMLRRPTSPIGNH